MGHMNNAGGGFGAPFQDKPQQFTCPNGFGVVDHFTPDRKSCDCHDRSKQYMADYGYRWSPNHGHWVGSNG